MKPLTLGAGQLWVHMFIYSYIYVHMFIYDLFHIHHSRFLECLERISVVWKSVENYGKLENIGFEGV